MYCQYLHGRGESGGQVDVVQTMSQFDTAVNDAFKVDTFKIHRIVGLLDFKTKWNNLLNFKGYGSTKHNAKYAKAQGGSEPPVLVMRYFTDSTGIMRMQYKHNELEPVYKPKNSEPIQVLKHEHVHEYSMRDIFDFEFEYSPCGIWEKRMEVQTYLTNNCTLLLQNEKEEWVDFFKDLPSTIKDLNESNSFSWTVPQLLEIKKKALEVQAERDAAHVDCDMFQEVDNFDDQTITHPKYTEIQRNKDRHQRGKNYSNEQNTKNESLQAMNLLSLLNEWKRNDNSDLALLPIALKSALPHKNPVNMNIASVIKIGDVVMVNPNDEGREQDRQNKYMLGVNLGEITSLHPCTNMASVWWWYKTGNSWAGKWIRWVNPQNNRPYVQELPLSDLLENTWGTVARIEHKTVDKGTSKEGFHITKESIQLIRDVIEERDDSWSKAGGEYTMTNQPTNVHPVQIALKKHSKQNQTKNPTTTKKKKRKATTTSSGQHKKSSSQPHARTTRTSSEAATTTRGRNRRPQR